MHARLYERKPLHVSVYASSHCIHPTKQLAHMTPAKSDNLVHLDMSNFSPRCRGLSDGTRAWSSTSPSKCVSPFLEGKLLVCC